MTEAARTYIHAAAALGPLGDTTAVERTQLREHPTPPDLRPRVKALCGRALRQASHLIELGVLGALTCHRRLRRPLHEGCGIYVGTGFGESKKCYNLFGQVMPPNQGLASPFDFINAANNMAAFYVAKLLDISTRNLTISQDEFSFEYALMLAQQDLQYGHNTQALVGGVDEQTCPLSHHLERLELPPERVAGEGGGWWFLDTEPEGALGELLAVVMHRTRDEGPEAWADRLGRGLAPWLAPEAPLTLLPGFRLDEALRAALERRLPRARVREYLPACGCFPTAAAFGVASVFDEPHGETTTYLHVNRDREGQTLSILFTALAGSGEDPEGARTRS